MLHTTTILYCYNSVSILIATTTCNNIDLECYFIHVQAVHCYMCCASLKHVSFNHQRLNAEEPILKDIVVHRGISKDKIVFEQILKFCLRNCKLLLLHPISVLAWWIYCELIVNVIRIAQSVVVWKFWWFYMNKVFSSKYIHVWLQIYCNHFVKITSKILIEM